MIIYSVTTILSKYLNFSVVPSEVLEAAAARGTEVHDYCANYALGIWSLTLPLCLEGYGLSFRRWFDEYVVEVLLVEQTLSDPVIGYKGKIDLIAKLKGDFHPSVIDYKTPITAGPTWDAQVAAYIHLANHNSIPAERGGDLKLKKDGSPAKYVPCENAVRAFTGFHHALNAHRYFDKRKEAA
jgi:hypothetical protein